MLGFSVETVIIIGNTGSAGTVVLIGSPLCLLSVLLCCNFL